MKTKLFIILLLITVLLFCACTKDDPMSNETNIHTDPLPEHTDTVVTTAPADTLPEDTVISVPSSNNLQFSPQKEGIYNYCPSAIQLDDGTIYIYYCTNRNSYEIVDYIGCRRGIRNADGKIEWSEEMIALSPSDDGWDAHHTCDPSVVAGSFSYNGEAYGYLMAYLGCTSYDNQENKIGLAVSKTPEGPFIKVGTEPLVDFTKDTGVTVFQWGVGQPSLINMDEKGQIYLFYTRGDKNGTRLMLDQWELSNLDQSQKLKTVTVSKNGLANLSGGTDFMNNADLLYDAETKRFYAISDCHPNPDDEPNYISSHFRLNYFTHGTSFTNFSWHSLKTVSPAETSFARNHNAGLLRTAYGYLPNDHYITAFYTVSVSGSESLWSYRIYDYNVEIK